MKSCVFLLSIGILVLQAFFQTGCSGDNGNKNADACTDTSDEATDNAELLPTDGSKEIDTPGERVEADGERTLLEESENNFEQENDDPPVVTISPQYPRLRTGRTMGFVANLPVNWSIEEGEQGGSISAEGIYTAPAWEGTYKVKATSTQDPLNFSSTSVTVLPPGLDLLAGALGGPGNIDGVGLAARFYRPRDGILDGAGNFLRPTMETILSAKLRWTRRK